MGSLFAISLLGLIQPLCNMVPAGGDEMYNVEIHQRIILYQRRQPSMDSMLCRQWHGLMHFLAHLTIHSHFHLHTHTRPSI